MDWILEYPFASYIIACVMSISTLLVIVLVPIAIAGEYNMAFRARVTGRNEIMKQLKFLDYIKTHHPEKLEPEKS